MAIKKKDLIELLVEARVNLPDEKALKFKSMYPDWKAGIKVEVGQRYQYGDKLYKVLQAHTTQENWTPDVTASLFEVIDIEHTGTKEDPIPWSRNMQCYKGKYYTYEGVLYLCTRNSGIALDYIPSELIDNYFELA